MSLSFAGSALSAISANLFNECDNGYFIGVRYTGSEPSISWQIGEEYCQEMYGTSLASIHSDLENENALNAALSAGATPGRPEFGKNEIWIGFHGIDDESRFVWADESQRDYVNWENGEPNDFQRNRSPGEDCTHMGPNGKWNDQACEGTDLSHTTTAFVCNKKWFSCAKECNELTSEQHGCANDECVKDCANCVRGIGWNDYSGGQDTSCQCHDNGCDQCKPGFFKVDYDYPCQDCSDFIGCLHCTDFYGCQECAQGYELVEDNKCGKDSYHNTGSVKVHYCKKISIEMTQEPTPHPTPMPVDIDRREEESSRDEREDVKCPAYDRYDDGSCNNDFHCDNCQEWGCAHCEYGYYKMGNTQRCQSCIQNYPNCKRCNDWNGCSECNYGYKLIWSHQCQDEICVLDNDY